MSVPNDPSPARRRARGSLGVAACKHEPEAAPTPRARGPGPTYPPAGYPPAPTPSPTPVHPRRRLPATDPIRSGAAAATALQLRQRLGVPIRTLPLGALRRLPQRRRLQVRRGVPQHAGRARVHAGQRPRTGAIPARPHRQRRLHRRRPQRRRPRLHPLPTLRLSPRPLHQEDERAIARPRAGLPSRAGAIARAAPTGRRRRTREDLPPRAFGQCSELAQNECPGWKGHRTPSSTAVSSDVRRRPGRGSPTATTPT